jgi:hypothetical protein
MDWSALHDRECQRLLLSAATSLRWLQVILTRVQVAACLIHRLHLLCPIFFFFWLGCSASHQQRTFVVARNNSCAVQGNQIAHFVYLATCLICRLFASSRPTACFPLQGVIFLISDKKIIDARECLTWMLWDEWRTKGIHQTPSQSPPFTATHASLRWAT